MIIVVTVSMQTARDEQLSDLANQIIKAFQKDQPIRIVMNEHESKSWRVMSWRCESEDNRGTIFTAQLHPFAVE